MCVSLAKHGWTQNTKCIKENLRGENVMIFVKLIFFLQIFLRNEFLKKEQLCEKQKNAYLYIIFSEYQAQIKTITRPCYTCILLKGLRG